MSFKISQYGLQRIDGNENSGLVYIICDGETIFSIQNSMYGFPKDNISINIEKYHVAEVFICVRQNSKEPCWIEISNLLVE